MAKRSTPPKPERPFHTLNQKRLDVQRLSRRISGLEEFDPQLVTKRFNDPNVTALETAIDEALASAFGHGTVEYNRYRAAASLDHGPVIMDVTPSCIAARGRGCADYHDKTAEAQQYIAEGKQQALGLLRQAVKGLEEEIADEEMLSEPSDHPNVVVEPVRCLQVGFTSCLIFEAPRQKDFIVFTSGHRLDGLGVILYRTRDQIARRLLGAKGPISIDASAK